MATLPALCRLAAAQRGGPAGKIFPGTGIKAQTMPAMWWRDQLPAGREKAAADNSLIRPPEPARVAPGAGALMPSAKEGLHAIALEKARKPLDGHGVFA